MAKAKYKVVREKDYGGRDYFRAYHYDRGWICGVWEYLGERDTLEDAKELIAIHRDNPVYEE